tara:strand:- start:811 stop:1074 length:264 start_codon:yes stop_codon:yes gene_type:complete
MASKNPTQLAIYKTNEPNTTYFTEVGHDLAEMMMNDPQEISYWRVIHAESDRTKPFITHHVGVNMLYIIQKEDPMFERLYQIHMGEF